MWKSVVKYKHEVLLGKFFAEGRDLHDTKINIIFSLILSPVQILNDDTPSVCELCPGCAGNTCQKLQSYGTWLLSSLVQCTHGKSGYDNKYVRDVYTTLSCQSCGYYKESTTKQYKTVCAGVN